MKATSTFNQYEKIPIVESLSNGSVAKDSDNNTQANNTINNFDPSAHLFFSNSNEIISKIKNGDLLRC